MKNDDNRRKPCPGKRPQGAGRRTWPAGGAGNDSRRGGGFREGGAPRGGGSPREDRGPRVGRVAGDVPRAQRVEADGFQRRDKNAGRDARQDVYRGNGAPRGGNARRGGEVHHGRAYRSESGPGSRRSASFAEEAPPERGAAAAGLIAEADPERLLAGRNPIREALKAGRPVEKLLVASGDLSGAAREILRMAREANVIVQQVDRARLDQLYPAHQGMLAYVAAVPYVQLEDILDAARAKGEDPFIVLLDGVTDPHNLGAIIRTAECAGAHGVVVPERRAAGLGPAAAKAAAGALSHMLIARVKNLNRAIDELKAQSVWVIGTAMDGEDALSADLTGPVALVIGSEGDGVGRLTLEKCDRTLALPMRGSIESLNASVAAGILMYEVVRARSQ